MITFLKRKGRLGNRLFQYASLLGLAEKYGHELRLPKWEHSEQFEWDVPEFNGQPTKYIVEPNYHYDPNFFEQHLSDKNAVIDICGWLQTEKYFSPTKKLRFKDSYIKKIFENNKRLFEKPTIAISIRRGDFILNPNYFQLPITYYICALFKHFPNWQDSNLVFFSDDIQYLKIHFGCLENAFFPELQPIDQLALGSLCTDIIISNSTFSWWMAYLNENPDKKVIRPLKNVDGELAKTHDEKDYWIESWKVFDHTNQKIDLKDCSFTIPVSFDHNDRRKNLELSVCLLQKSFDTKIIIGEQGGKTFQYMREHCKYMSFEGIELFHRTKMLNDMAMKAETPIVVNYDADNVIAPMQLWLAAEKIRNGADMVYPFDGQSARVPREEFRKMERYLDAGVLKENYRGLGKYDSVGHAVFFDRQKFIEGGMENENMISWAPEDVERYERFTRLGYKVEKIKGAIFHMDHFVGVNSGKGNPHYERNCKELEKIRKMSVPELREYVNGWTWTHPYTANYYDSFSEDAVRSRDEVFKVLPFKPKSVIDVGCGVGEWGYQIEKLGVIRYRGCDYKIPEDKLLIEKRHFFEINLNDIPENYEVGRFALAISLEVGEHLWESQADKLVKLLCSLSDYVLFSAAIPGQGGVDHKNEQWQTWWEKLFNDNGYYASEEAIRDKIKDNSNIEIWYRNNMVLYSKHYKGKVENFVHPELFVNIVKHLKSA